MRTHADSWVGAISCVLRSQDATMWYKDGGGDFLIPVPCKHAKEGTQLDAWPQISDDLSREIVDAENSSAWTLMHRWVPAAAAAAAAVAAAAAAAAAALAALVWQGWTGQAGSQ